VKNSLLIKTVLALFFMSGACGLIYQSLWPQYLKLLLGHSAYAQSIVLVVFIGGMAIGSWLAAKLGKRIKSPLLGYATCEALIGVMAIVFHQIYVPVSDWAYQTLLPNACAAEGWCGVQWGLAALLITPQSILLGATFPFLAAGLLRHLRENTGWLLGAAYGLNTLGAVLGVLLSSFVLLPNIGLPGTMLVAGFANLLVACAVYAIDRRLAANASAAPLAPHPKPEIKAESEIASAVLFWVAALTGLSSFVYEIAWIRMLSLILGSATHTFEIVLAGYLFGLGCGSYWIKGQFGKIKDIIVFLAKVQLAMGAFAALTIFFYHSGFEFLAWVLSGLGRTPTGYSLYLGASGLLTLAFVFPTTFCAGMTLPLITHTLLKTPQGESAIGNTYAANTLGSIAGILLTVHLGLPWLGLELSLGLGAIVDVALGVLLLWLTKPESMTSTLPRIRVAAIAVLAMVVAIVACVRFDPLYTAAGVFRYGHARFDPHSSQVLFNADGKTASVSVVTFSNGTTAIQTNGKPDAAIALDQHKYPAATDEYTMTIAGLVGPLYRPQAQRVAVIGFGSGMSTAVLLSYPSITQLDTIEIEPKMVEGAKHFQSVVSAAFTDPRSHIVIDDAKSYFARNGVKYDIIVTEPSNPWVSGVSSLFTEEFYQRVSRSLSADGVLVQWVQLYEFDTRLLSSIIAAMRTVFPEYEVYTDENNIIMVAARHKIGTPDYALLQQTGPQRWLSRLKLTPDSFRLRRVAGNEIFDRYLAASPAPANSDYFPFVDNNAPQARFTQASTTAVAGLKYAPVPLIRWFESAKQAPEASFSFADFVKNTDVHSAQVRNNGARLESAIAQMESPATACASPKLAKELITSMVLVGEALPTVKPGTNKAFWRDYALPDCPALKDANALEWKNLLQAVASDDLPQVIRQADTLRSGLTADRSTETEFLALAHIGALAAQNRKPEADAVLRTYANLLRHEAMNKPWFVLLKSNIQYWYEEEQSSEKVAPVPPLASRVN